MKLSELAKGKTYFKINYQGNSRTQIRKKTVSKIYVLEVDHSKNMVFASINSLPPVWYKAKQIARWKTEVPKD